MHTVRSVHRHAPHDQGFTLVDLLVSLAVIALLISLLAPSLSLAQETARRVACASNARQIGIGVQMYAEDFNDRIPPTQFARITPSGQAYVYSQMMIISKLGWERAMELREETGRDSRRFDGLGVLYESQYLSHAGVFYCPSHRGEKRYSDFAEAWADTYDPREIPINYQYRGIGPQNVRWISGLPSYTALVTDGMQTAIDYNHQVGSNVLRADMSADWYEDEQGIIAASLPKTPFDRDGSARVDQAWQLIDQEFPSAARRGEEPVHIK